MYAIYCRLDVHVCASDLTVIRRTAKLLNKKARKDRSTRAARHAFYREMLLEHRAARKLYCAVVSGNI